MVPLHISQYQQLLQTKTLGLIQFVYVNRPEMAEPMYSYWAPDSYWSWQYFYFLYRG